MVDEALSLLPLSCAHDVRVIKIQLEALLQLMYENIHRARLLNLHNAHQSVQ